MRNYYVWIYYGESLLPYVSGYDRRRLSVNVEEQGRHVKEVRFSDVYIDVAGMYYESHQGHHDNKNYCSANKDQMWKLWPS